MHSIIENNDIKNWQDALGIAYGHNFTFNKYSFNFDFVYRGRPFNDHDLASVKQNVCQVNDMWCPPAESATKQRCNKKGDPILYLSSHISTIPYELCTKLGDYIPVIVYKSIAEVKPLAIIGWKKLIQIEELSKIISNHYVNKSDTIMQIDETFGKYFSQKKRYNIFQHKWFFEKYNMTKFTDDIYDITIGITDFYFSKNVIGIVYPSVENNYKAANFALKPNAVKHILVPISINIYQFMGSNSHDDVTMRLVCTGAIKSDEKIVWENIDSLLIQRFEK